MFSSIITYNNGSTSYLTMSKEQVVNFGEMEVDAIPIPKLENIVETRCTASSRTPGFSEDEPEPIFRCSDNENYGMNNEVYFPSHIKINNNDKHFARSLKTCIGNDAVFERSLAEPSTNDTLSTLLGDPNVRFEFVHVNDDILQVKVHREKLL